MSQQTSAPRPLLLRGGRLVDPAANRDETTDLLLRDGVVAAIGQEVTMPDIEEVDVTGLVVCPGFIDAHVHLREPGFEHKETIKTGAEAAAAGGFTSIVTMPNTAPPPDSATRVADLVERYQAGCVRIYPMGTVTGERAGKGLAPLQQMAAAGAVGFSDDGDPVEDESLMRRALQVAAETGIPIAPHEEVKSLTTGGCMHEGDVSRRLGFIGMPGLAEEQMIARDIDLVRETGGPLHILHISTAGTVELVREAKASGLPVTCEVLPHHFLMTHEQVESLGTAAKMSPPLREQADVDAMIAGLKDGTIDTLATDHAPHTAQEKALPFLEAPMGIVGLETAIGHTLTHLLHGGVLDLAAVIDRWSVAPARILHLAGGRLQVGDVADVTLLDLHQTWTVDSSRFHSKSTNTPFDGQSMRGR
ncbi:MAG: dihydroorotase, partial [Gemmatimonadetes bacterium]|nr:dihydroorotase [Gemmatimonadota bacterium]